MEPALSEVEGRAGWFEGFTADYNIERLVYFEEFHDVRNGIDREKQVKCWSRAKKLTLIAGMNPTWLDLSEGWYHPESLVKR
jgi:putative endonuclease